MFEIYIHIFYFKFVIIVVNEFCEKKPKPSIQDIMIKPLFSQFDYSIPRDIKFLTYLFKFTEITTPPGDEGSTILTSKRHKLMEFV